jgi:hypothetical protein
MEDTFPTPHSGSLSKGKCLQLLICPSKVVSPMKQGTSGAARDIQADCNASGVNGERFQIKKHYGD